MKKKLLQCVSSESLFAFILIAASVQHCELLYFEIVLLAQKCNTEQIDQLIITKIKQFYLLLSSTTITRLV